MMNEQLPADGTVAQGVFRVDAEARISFVDEQAAQMLGYAPAELIGRRFTEFHFEAELPLAQSNFAKRRLGIGGVTEYSLRHKDGSAVRVAVASAPTLDAGGDFLGITGFVTDIDARRRQEALSAHERRLLRMIAGNYPLASVLEDLCLTLEAVSRRPLRATVMLAAGDCLSCIAAPSLPPDFSSNRAVTRLEGSGTACAEAVRSGRKVVVGDTARPDVSPDIAACRATYGFGAIWSYPIEQDADILGTLALLLPTAGEPDAEDERAIEFAIQVARLALARERDARSRQESEQRLRDFAELSADWFWEQDADFRFIEMSGGAFNKGGFRVADSLGKTRWELPVEGIDAAQWAAHRASLERHEVFRNFTYSIRVADGTLHWYSVSGTPVLGPDGEFFGYRGIGSDITGQVAARNKLEKTRRWLEQAVLAAKIGLWERDVETWAFQFSRNWKTIFGYAEDEIGNSFADFDALVHPDDLARIHAFARAYERNPQGDYESRFRIRHKDGSWRWVLSRGNVAAGPDTGRRTWMGCHIDITEQKHSEEQLRDLTAMLETRVKARTAELEEANRELEAFNFSVSHDLRTPLRAIEGFSRALLEDCDEQLDQTGREYLRRICGSTVRMGELIDALYGLSRMVREPLRLSPVDLSAMARELVAELREQDPQRTVAIEIAATPLAQGDVRLLRIVLANLLGNAWKFTGKATEARIVLGAQRDEDGRVVYFVRDNGAGFDMQFADKLFRIFHRLHREEEFPGQGVGLTTAQRIVARHGGRVWGEAERGAGASFYFTLWTDTALLADAQGNMEDAETEFR